MQNDEKRIAVFIDFENVAVGVKESNYGTFNIELVLRRLVEKGKILVKRAYSDWHRYGDFKRAFHQESIELIDVPQTRYSGKNSADIRMVVDAMDLANQKEHIDTFVLVSGDSDFSPLVSKLRENGRYVIGMGVKNSSSDLLVNNCDEFIYYEDLVRPVIGPAVEDPRLRKLPAKKAEAFRMVLESFQALQREGKEVIYGSMIKQTLVRKLPSFNESYYGYPTFSRLLEEVAENNFLKIAKDQKSGGYIVNPVLEEGGSAAEVQPAGEPSGENGKAPETAPGRDGHPRVESFERHRQRWGRGDRTGAPPRRFPSHGRPGRGPGGVPKPGESSGAASTASLPADIPAETGLAETTVPAALPEAAGLVNIESPALAPQDQPERQESTVSPESGVTLPSPNPAGPTSRQPSGKGRHPKGRSYRGRSPRARGPASPQAQPQIAALPSALAESLAPSTSPQPAAPAREAAPEKKAPPPRGRRGPSHPATPRESGRRAENAPNQSVKIKSEGKKTAPPRRRSAGSRRPKPASE